MEKRFIDFLMKKDSKKIVKFCDNIQLVLFFILVLLVFLVLFFSKKELPSIFYILVIIYLLSNNKKRSPANRLDRNSFSIICKDFANIKEVFGMCTINFSVL